MRKSVSKPVHHCLHHTSVLKVYFMANKKFSLSQYVHDGKISNAQRDSTGDKTPFFKFYSDVLLTTGPF